MSYNNIKKTMGAACVNSDTGEKSKSHYKNFTFAAQKKDFSGLGIF